MKKILIVPLVALLLNSCDEAPKNELEAQENIAESIELGKVYGPVDYNDGLLAEITLLDVKLAMLESLDEIDTVSNVMVSACKEAIVERDRVLTALDKIESFGVKGNEFKQSMIDYSNAIGEIFNLYNSYAELLSTPDEEWTEEDAAEWDEKYNILYEEFLTTNDNVIAVQEEYSTLNSMDLGAVGASGEEIYEESLKNKE